MRLLLCVICFLASLPSGAIAGPKEEALEVVDKWTKAFADSDVDAIVSLNAPDALFMGTGSQTVVTEPAAVRKYFEDALLTRKPRAAPISSSEVMVLSDTAVVIAGLNTSTGVLDGKTYEVYARHVASSGLWGFQVVKFELRPCDGGRASPDPPSPEGSSCRVPERRRRLPASDPYSSAREPCRFPLSSSGSGPSRFR